MAAFDIYRANTPAAKSGLNLSILTNLIGSVVAWNDERVTRKALSSLSTRELDDIGLTRGDIDAIAHKSAY